MKKLYFLIFLTMVSDTFGMHLLSSLFKKPISSMPNATPEEKKVAIKNIYEEYRDIENHAISLWCISRDIAHGDGIYHYIPKECPLHQNNLSAHTLKALAPLTLLTLLKYNKCKDFEKRPLEWNIYSAYIREGDFEKAKKLDNTLIFNQPIVDGKSCLDFMAKYKEKVCAIDSACYECESLTDTVKEIKKYIKRNPAERSMTDQELKIFKHAWDWVKSTHQN